MLTFKREGQAFRGYDNAGRMHAEVTFPLTGEGHWNVDHTYVDPDLRGQGVASRLVALVVEAAEAEGHLLIATCPYVVDWRDRHPETAQLWVRPHD